MSTSLKRSRLYATLIAAFPVTLAVGILLIPVVADYDNHQQASEAASDTLRWFLGHIHAAVAFSIGLLACACIGDLLYRKGEGRRVILALPAVVIGAGLMSAGLGADGIGPLAVAEAQGDPALFFDGSGRLITGLFIAGAVLFGLGMIALIFGLLRIDLLRGPWKFIVPTAAILFVLFQILPTGWGLYGVALSAFLVFIPVSLALRRSVLVS